MSTFDNAEEKEPGKKRKNNAFQREKRDARAATDRVGPSGPARRTRARRRKAFRLFPESVSPGHANFKETLVKVSGAFDSQLMVHLDTVDVPSQTYFD